MRGFENAAFLGQSVQRIVDPNIDGIVLLAYLHFLVFIHGSNLVESALDIGFVVDDVIITGLRRLAMLYIYLF